MQAAAAAAVDGPGGPNSFSYDNISHRKRRVIESKLRKLQDVKVGTIVRLLFNNVTYTGTIKDRLFDGKGRLDYINEGQRPFRSYEGFFHLGILHGNGRMTLNDGSIYEGEFKKGFFNGNGKLTTLSGDTWEGQFLNNLPDGIMVLKTSIGKKYTGQLKENNNEWYYHGLGKLECKDYTYEGFFHFGKFDGPGKIKYEDDEQIEEGQFLNGEKHGLFAVTDSEGQRQVHYNNGIEIEQDNGRCVIC